MLRKIVILITFFPLVLSCSSGVKRFDTNFLALNTQCSVIYYSINEIDGIIDSVVQMENYVSRHIEESDIFTLNEAAGKNSAVVDDLTTQVLDKALYYSKLSNGRFDLTIGPLVTLWNINERVDLPIHSEVESTVELVDYKKLEKVGDREYFLEDEGMLVDLGGIAKGYAADIVRDLLIENGVETALINLGGNVLTIGQKTDGSNWKIGIQHPRGDRGSYIGILELSDASFVTSGDYERYFEVDGKRYHHILDSKGGYPIEGEIISSSIVSKNSIDGDALSTITFGMSMEEIKDVMTNTDAQGIFINRDRDIYISEELVEKFTLKDDSYRLISY